MHKIDVWAYISFAAAFLTQLVTLGFPQALDAIFPGYGTKASIVISFALVCLGAALRVKGNPTPPSGFTSVIAPAAAVAPTTANITTVPAAVAQAKAAP